MRSLATAVDAVREIGRGQLGRRLTGSVAHPTAVPTVRGVSFRGKRVTYGLGRMRKRVHRHRLAISLRVIWSPLPRLA